ncbi:MAG TPA: hypothetical protein VH062_02400 [Polyangiaceae bacterium]|jgi:hypothetical protein|nr:hypothetical protein [Polyangiaceae bacterium]
MITVKEEFLTCAKIRRAIELGGHEMTTLWLCLKRYAAMNPTDGFIPDEDVEGCCLGLVANPRKKVEALVLCGGWRNGTRGAGLVEKVLNGWQLHDYEDHANSQTDEDLRKEKARLKKREQRQRKELELERVRAELARGTMSPPKSGQRGDMSRGHEGTCPGDSPGDEDEGHSGARWPAPGLVRDPSPTQPDPTQPIPPREAAAGSARERERVLGQRPARLPQLLPDRISVVEYEPLEGHASYAAELRLSPELRDKALLDLRDKYAGKPHYPQWLDETYSAFLEAAARPRRGERRRGPVQGGPAGYDPFAEAEAGAAREQAERAAAGATR